METPFQITKGVLCIPRHGFANHLRCLASCAILAAYHGVPLYVHWKPEVCFPIAEARLLFQDPPWSSLDPNTLSPREYQYDPTVHTDILLREWSQRRLPSEIGYLIVEGGHEFKPPQMDPFTYMLKKHAFYGRLVWTPSVRIPEIQYPEIGLHLRIFQPTYDTDDGYDFENRTQLEVAHRYVQTLLEEHPDLQIFLACNDTPTARQFRARYPLNRILLYEDFGFQDATSGQDDRASPHAMMRALREFQILSLCDLILGTHRSSFSDEACFFGPWKSKVCLSVKPREDPYHIYGYYVLEGLAMVLPDFKVVCRLKKQT